MKKLLNVVYFIFMYGILCGAINIAIAYFIYKKELNGLTVGYAIGMAISLGMGRLFALGVARIYKNIKRYIAYKSYRKNN